MKLPTPVIIALVGSSIVCHGGGPKHCATCYHMHMTGRNKNAPPIMLYGRQTQPDAFIVAGERVETLRDFQAVVASLPRGSELIWEECPRMTSLPIAGGPISVEAVQKLCANHGVTFTVFTWGY